MTAAYPTAEKHGKPALLAVVQAVVERLGGGGQLSEIRGAGAQALGCPARRSIGLTSAFAS